MIYFADFALLLSTLQIGSQAEESHDDHSNEDTDHAHDDHDHARKRRQTDETDHDHETTHNDIVSIDAIHCVELLQYFMIY